MHAWSILDGQFLAHFLLIYLNFSLGICLLYLQCWQSMLVTVSSTCTHYSNYHHFKTVQSCLIISVCVYVWCLFSFAVATMTIIILLFYHLALPCLAPIDTY